MVRCNKVKTGKWRQSTTGRQSWSRHKLLTQRHWMMIVNLSIKI